MGLFTFFSRSKAQKIVDNKNTESANFTPLPGTELNFYPDLIDNLKDDHQNLLAIYTAMGEALENENFSQLTELFNQFKVQLHRHILKENLKLYIYLTHAITNDQKSLDTIRELKSEMQKIGRAVNKFLEHYSQLPWTEEQKNSFPEEFNTTGSILLDRIEREEKILYPLYLHPETYISK